MFVFPKTSRETKNMDDAEQQPFRPNEMETNQHLEMATDDKGFGGLSKRCVRPWTAQQLDCCARWSYPIIFILFNLCYWSFYMGGASDLIDQSFL